MTLTQLTIFENGECQIDIDGKRTAVIDIGQVKKLGLSEGCTVSETLLEKICALSDLLAAKNSAFRSLSHTDFSQAGLVKRLCEKGIARHDAEMAVEELAEKGYLSDRDYAEKLVRVYRDEKCFGPRRVREELFKRGIPRELSEELLEGSAYNIDGYCTKKFSQLKRDEKTRRKVIGALQRAGYGYEEIRGALARLFEEEDSF